MKNIDQRNKVIEFSLKLNSTNLSPLRSGNISLRSEENGVNGYLITPSGKKYSSLKNNDIVFVSLNGYYEKKKEFLPLNGSFIKIFTKTKKKQKQLFMHIQHVLQQFLLTREEYHLFIIW